MINLFLAMNPGTSSNTKFPMSEIKQKLTSHYDIDLIHERELERLADARDGSESEDDAEIPRLLQEANFELPYATYRDLIEAHAQGTAGPSVSASPIPDSQSQSTKAESPLETPNAEEEQEVEEEKPAPAKRGRKRATTTTAAPPKERPAPKLKRTGTASGSINGSADTGTPGKESDEEENSRAGSDARGNNKKQRTAPSRKSSRKK